MPTTLHPPRPRVPLRELAVPVLAVLVVAVAPVLVWSRLPDPVAIHWGIDGRPDGSAPLVLDAVLLTVTTALVAVLPLLSAANADRRVARLLVGLAHGMAGLFVLLRVRTLQLNVDAVRWDDAGALTLGDVGLMVLVTAPLVGLGWWLGGQHPDPVRATRPITVPALPADGRLLWVGHQSWPVGRLLGPLLVILAGAVTTLRVAPETLLVGATLALAGVTLWWFTSITVAVGPTGLKVRFGPLGWPRVRVPLAEIETVEVEDVEPMAYGGWGYRVMPGVRAVVIRRGPGLRVKRTGQADLIVTVDDAATAAGVLAAHLAAARGEGGPGSSGE